jgi:hypothetical protein
MAYEEFHAVIVHPFYHKGKNYTKGVTITDPAEVEMLHVDDREAHFVRIAAPPAPTIEETPVLTSILASAKVHPDRLV